LKSILWIATVVFLMVGVACLVLGWRQANQATSTSAAKSGVLSSIASGLLTGGVLSLALALLQTYVAEATEEANWRANVAVAHELIGFDPHGHSLDGLSFNAKILTGASFEGMSLKGLKFANANLEGAHLERADLTDVALAGANLSTAELNGADLSGASLEGTEFDRAGVERVKSFLGAVATPATCWPSGFLELPVAKGLKSGRWDDGLGHVERGVGHEYPCPKKYRTRGN